MLKIFLVLMTAIIGVMATEVSATSQNIRSYPLAVKNGYIKTELNIFNKDLDIFTIQDNANAGTAAEHGILGDLKSINFNAGVGLYEHTALFYNVNFLNIDYAGESLKNRRHELFAKLNIYNNPQAMFDTLSTDIGYIHNSADDISISGSSLGISQMDDMSDSSFYVQMISGSKILSSILDFYLGLRYTTINTKIDTISYDRDEIGLNAGFQYTLEFGRFLVETGYEYIRLFQRDISHGQNSNHIFNLTLSRALSPKLLLYIGSKLYINQFNGVIPYLYNEKTKESFDQRFGYATIGLVYNFDLAFLNH